MPAPSHAQIHKLIAQLGRDPDLIDKLLAEPDPGKRKGILVGRGLLKRDDTPSREEIVKEMIKLGVPTGSTGAPGPGASPVEWVGAIASAAAGAASAACGN